MNMSYCRHENTANDLKDVADRWYDFDPEHASRREVEARARIIEMVHTLHHDFKNDGTYDEAGL